MTDAPDQRNSDSQLDRSVIDAVDCNTQLLRQLLEQFVDIRGAVLEGQLPSDLIAMPVDESTTSAECERLRDHIYELENQVGELQAQNGDLASQAASSNVRQTVSAVNCESSDAFSWEDRKKLIIQQMEADSFDPQDFIESSRGETAADAESPSEFVEGLCADLAKREQELDELRCLLEQQPATGEEGVASGPAAIAEMVDADELVQQECERLQLLQAEWEEKFRQEEIEASLERAKLSRERQTLAKKQSELDEYLEQARRDSHHYEASGSTSSRRWLIKLGLADNGG